MSVCIIDVILSIIRSAIAARSVSVLVKNGMFRTRRRFLNRPTANRSDCFLRVYCRRICLSVCIRVNRPSFSCHAQTSFSLTDELLFYLYRLKSQKFYSAKYISAHNMTVTAVNTVTTLTSLQPHISK